MKYGPNEIVERSQNPNLNDDEYTSDDSVYQSEENPSSTGSTSPTHQNDIIFNMGLPQGTKSKPKKRKDKKEHQNEKIEAKPRIELAVRRSTASLIDSRSTPISSSSKRSNNICPLHDESDFIGKGSFHIVFNDYTSKLNYPEQH